MTSIAAAKAPPLRPAPFLTSVMQIEPQWIDYNGHLNMAYYNVMFDRGIDELWLQLGIGPGYMKERHGSTFTAECHVRYLREIHLGDPVQISILLLGADEKRLHTFEELRHATEGWLSATSENMTIHIDMNARKTAPFPLRHPRPHRGGRQCPRRGAAPRGRRAESRDAFALDAGASGARRWCVRAQGPTTAETRNRITAIKKIVLAISMEAPARPPKPNTPAINAIIRKVTTQLNMTRSSSPIPRNQSVWETKVPGRETRKIARYRGTKSGSRSHKMAGRARAGLVCKTGREGPI